MLDGMGSGEKWHGKMLSDTQISLFLGEINNHAIGRRIQVMLASNERRARYILPGITAKGYADAAQWKRESMDMEQEKKPHEFEQYRRQSTPRSY